MTRHFFTVNFVLYNENYENVSLKNGLFIAV